MLAYAFEFVDDAMLKRAGSEPFENQQELLASLLDAGIGKQLKRGLFREYIPKKESIMGVRGRICMTETMRNRFARKQSIACSFDELSEDNLHNQIIKATARLLIGSPDVDPLHTGCSQEEDTFLRRRIRHRCRQHRLGSTSLRQEQRGIPIPAEHMPAHHLRHAHAR